jgi:hypothetical protein
MEVRLNRPYVWLFDEERRLISTPKNANGAQQAIDHDLPQVNTMILHMRTETYTPHTAMMIVALRRLCTNGAMIMLLANMQ